MTLNSQTKIGLTFGQIISLIGVLATVGYSWMTINIRVSNLEVKNNQSEMNIKKLYDENRQDHSALFVKMDEIYKLELQKYNYHEKSN